MPSITCAKWVRHDRRCRVQRQPVAWLLYPLAESIGSSRLFAWKDATRPRFRRAKLTYRSRSPNTLVYLPRSYSRLTCPRKSASCPGCGLGTSAPRKMWSSSEGDPHRTPSLVRRDSLESRRSFNSLHPMHAQRFHDRFGGDFLRPEGPPEVTRLEVTESSAIRPPPPKYRNTEAAKHADDPEAD
jgi:hypothetical protein